MKGKSLLLFVSVIFLCVVVSCMYIWKIGVNGSYTLMRGLSIGSTFPNIVIIVLTLIFSIGLYIVLGKKPE